MYDSWPQLADAKDAVKRLRIVQVLPKTTPHANTPRVGLANASPGKQVLGTVPVEPDGSAYFRAPAGIPLAFQALDERGMAVQTMRSLTYLQPGEQAGCVGCHEQRTHGPRRSRGDAGGPARAVADHARPRRLEAVQLPDPGAAGAGQALRPVPQPARRPTAAST